MAYDGPSVVDFSPLRGPGPLAHAMDPIVAAIDDLAARRHQERMQREREEAISARAKVDDQLNREKFESDRIGKNISHRSETEAQVRAALDAGEYDKAKAIAAGYQEVGPGNAVSKGLPGFDLKKPDPGPAPEAPPPPDPVQYGPQASPEDVRRAAEIRSQQDGAGSDKAAIEMQMAEGARFAGARDAGQEEGPVASPADSRRAALARQEQASFEPPPPVNDAHAQFDAMDLANSQDGQKVQVGNQLIPAQYLETVMAHDRDMGMWRDRANAAPEATVGGVPYDVQGQHKAQVARRTEDAESTRAAFAGKVEPKYVDLLSAMVASDVPQARAAAAAPGMLQKDQALDLRAQIDERDRPPWQVAERGKDRRAQIAAGARVKAAGVNTDVRRDQANRANIDSIDRTVERVYKGSGMPKLLAGKEALDNARGALESNSGPGDAEAVVAIARSFRQGVPTVYEEKNLRAHMGGIADRIMGIASQAYGGRLSEGQRAEIGKLMDSAEKEMAAHIQTRYQGFAKGLASDPSLANYPEVVNSRLRARLQPLFGDKDVPDVMTGGEGAPMPYGAGLGLNRKGKATAAPAPAGGQSAVDDILKEWESRNQ